MRHLGTMAPAVVAVMMTSTFALTMGGMTSKAVAQEPDELAEDSVLTRSRPEFDPLGIRAGSFLILPQLRVATSFDDNIFAEEDDEDDDIIFDVQPSVQFRSLWARHSLQVTADADAGIFLDNDDSNFEDFGLQTTGRIDVIGQSAIRLTGFIRRDHEDRDNPEEGGAEEVTQLIDGGFGINYRHVINRLFIQPGVSVRRRDYDDADQINNDDRDIWQYAPTLRVGYALSPDVAFFVGGEFNQKIYDETPDDRGVDRDSQGFAVTLGSEFDLTGKLLGEFQVGFQSQEFDDSDLEDFSGVRADGEITYNLTPLTAFVLNVGAGLEETTVTLLGEDASSNFRTNANLRLIHELRRNIILRAEGSYIRDDFEGIDRTDDRFGVGAGIGYALNRNLSLDVNYEFTTRSSDVDGVDFDRNVISAGVTARF